jgi:hypothetical protein
MRLAFAARKASALAYEITQRRRQRRLHGNQPVTTDAIEAAMEQFWQAELEKHVVLRAGEVRWLRPRADLEWYYGQNCRAIDPAVSYLSGATRLYRRARVYGTPGTSADTCQDHASNARYYAERIALAFARQQHGGDRHTPS